MENNHDNARFFIRIRSESSRPAFLIHDWISVCCNDSWLSYFFLVIPWSISQSSENSTVQTAWWKLWSSVNGLLIADVCHGRWCCSVCFLLWYLDTDKDTPTSLLSGDTMSDHCLHAGSDKEYWPIVVSNRYACTVVASFVIMAVFRCACTSDDEHERSCLTLAYWKWRERIFDLPSVMRNTLSQIVADEYAFQEKNPGTILLLCFLLFSSSYPNLLMSQVPTDSSCGMRNLAHCGSTFENERC